MRNGFQLIALKRIACYNYTMENNQKPSAQKETPPPAWQQLGRNERGQQTVRVRGVVSSIVFRNEQDDWSVLTVKVGDKKVRVTGHTAAQEGQEVEAQGAIFEKENTSGWKNQITTEIKAERIIATTPRSAKGVASFLSANVRGVGPVLAKRLAQALGEDLHAVLDDVEQHDRLKDIKGLTPTIREAMKVAWQEHKAVADIMLFLHDQSLSPSLCRRIHRCYGEKAREVLQENPYSLAEDVRGIGFLKADEIAANLGVSRMSEHRLRAGLLHVLTEASSQGHCGLERDELMERASTALGATQKHLESALGALIQHRSIRKDGQQGDPLVVNDAGHIWLNNLYRAEMEIARRLMRMCAIPKKPPANLDERIEAAAKRAGIALAEAQTSAVRMALTQRVSIITGGPGCGKTTVLRVVLDLMRKEGLTIALAAPTGKAAQRASQAAGQAASTLHRLLKIGPAGPDMMLAADVLVVDEVSMVDVPLMRNVLRGIQPHTTLLLVGDRDQLPSVGPGSVLGDLIDSRRIACTRLNVIHRQGKGSLIIENAHHVNNGRAPQSQRSDGDFFFIDDVRDPRLGARGEENAGVAGQAALETILDLVTRRLPQKYGLDPMRDIAVLSPMNNGRCGVRALNEHLQKALNPNEDANQCLRVGALRFAAGDKVLQTRNNYDLGVFNGDSGHILEVDKEKKCLRIAYDDGSGGENVIEHPFEDADELKLAYAITVHKAQGGQAPCVIIPVLGEHFTMLERNLLYTGITRAKSLCIIVGSRFAVGMAVNRVSAAKRNTLLCEFLNGYVPPKEGGAPSV